MFTRLLLSFIFTLICFQMALGCSCTISPSPTKALRSADAVFMGKVIAISPSIGNNKKVLFKVEKAWKGVIWPLVSVSTNTSGASCGNSYSLGENWLVYAEGTDTLSSNLCSRTTHVRNAQQDLQVLGAGFTPSSVVLWAVFILFAGIISSISVLWRKKRWR